ncbi:MAG: GHKL domain-containing protein [Deltaproteobacteria bacterium]|nr:GHKL domain-containing protein [Deltaproteobacteria bacterium]
MDQKIEFETLFNILRDISTSLHSGARVKDVFEILAMKSAQMLNARGALIRILNPKTNHMDLGAAYGLSDQYLSKGPAFRKEFVMDLCRQNRILVIRDILNDPFVQYPKEAWQEGIRMMIDAPITYKDDVLGILRIYFDEPREFSEEELHSLILIAERGAAVIQRAQLLEIQESRYDQLALQTEKLSALGRMAAGIAHEINNPLAGILLFSSNLLKKAPEEGPFKEGLQIIIQETLRCKAIIQDLLEFSRPSEPKTFLTNVNKVIVKTIHLLDNEFRLHHIRVEVDLSKQLPEILIDENQIEQIFVNLLLNAIQAIEEKGTVTIHSYITSDRKNVAIDISDTGCGIPPENMSKIFEPFFSTKAKGTGLGLAVTYGIIQKHGGHVYAFSQPKQGSRFIVELPIASGLHQEEMKR